MVELDDLSRRITECWASLGRHLGVEEDVIESITANNVEYPSPEKKAFQMLKAWAKKGKASTIAKLAAALRRVNKVGLAEQLECSLPTVQSRAVAEQFQSPGRSKTKMIQFSFIFIILLLFLIIIFQYFYLRGPT